MTEEPSIEFLTFSELLDCEDDLMPSGETSALLLELRRELRAEPDLPPLPDDFASSTARNAEQRYRASSGLTRALAHLLPVFQGRPFSAPTLPWLFAGAIGGLLCLSQSWHLLGSVAALVLFGSLLLAWQYQRRLPGSLALPEASLAVDGSQRVRVFFVVPLLAVLATSALAGSAISRLGEVSLSFKSNGGGFGWIGAATVLVMFAWLYNACWPLWKAYEEASRGRWLRAFVVQAGHWLWLLTVLVLWRDLSDTSIAWFDDGLAAGGLAAGVAGSTFVAIAATRQRRPQGRETGLWRALKRSFTGFLVGVVPIGLTMILYYQATLTREIAYPRIYQSMRRDVAAWLARESALPPESNGATELMPYFYRHDPGDSPNTAVSQRLKKGGELDPAIWKRQHRKSSQRSTERAASKALFLQELPRIEAALSKPSFSWVRERDLSYATMVPNFVLIRAVSQGLAGLAADALEEGDSAQALRYTLLGLRWSTKARPGVLLNLMIGVAQSHIASDGIEPLLFQGRLDREQLRQLLATLQQTGLRREDFADSMLRETYAADQTFQALAAGKSSESDWRSLWEPGTTGWMLRLFPRSYWISERNVFMNLELSQYGSWVDLDAPDELNLLSLLPWNLATQGLVINTSRAQIQVMWSLSRFAAFEQETALELYKADHGSYPDRLQSLVPQYLKSLPADAMSPNLWKMKTGFSYVRDGNSYHLYSDSPLYQEVHLARRQSYGPDGDYNESRL
jgi:hypothetical protein